MDSLFERLREATSYVSAAVASDQAQDYGTAYQNYQKALEIMEREINNAPLKDRQAFAEKIDIYKQRVHEIEAMNLDIIKSMPIQETEEFVEDKISPSAYPEICPSSVIVRPYWLMETLHKSITSGTFITPQVYLPKEAWTQQNTKLSNGLAKISVCVPVYELITKIRIAQESGNVDEIKKVLSETNSKLIYIQSYLSGLLDFVSPPDPKMIDQAKDKEFRKSLVKPTAAKDELQVYTDILGKIFSEGKSIASWVEKHFKEPEFVVELKKLSDFFNNVFCEMIIKDVQVLHKKFLKSQIRSIERK